MTATTTSAPSSLPVLLATRDDQLLGDVLRLAAAAGTTLDVAHDPGSALRSWTSAALVLVGADLAEDLSRLRPARHHDVHVLGVSSLAAAHLTLVPELKAELTKQGRGDIMIVVGGVVPPQDYEALYKSGAEAIFPPGTVIAEAAEEHLPERLQRRSGAPEDDREQDEAQEKGHRHDRHRVGHPTHGGPPRPRASRSSRCCGRSARIRT